MPPESRHPNPYFPKLRTLELLNLPPKFQRELLADQRSYRAHQGTAAQAAVAIARGCPALKTIRLINPSLQSDASIEVNVRDAREIAATLDAKNGGGYSAYLATLPQLSGQHRADNDKVLGEVFKSYSFVWRDIPRLW